MTHQHFNERGYLVDRACAVIGRDIIPVVYKFDVHLKGHDASDRSATVKAFVDDEGSGWTQEFAMEIDRIGKVVVLDTLNPLAVAIHSVIATEYSHLFLTVHIEPVASEQALLRPRTSEDRRKGILRETPQGYGDPESKWASAVREVRKEKQGRNEEILATIRLEQMRRSRNLD